MLAASNSSPVPVTVSKESSKTAVNMVTFDINGNPLNYNATGTTYGAPYILRVDVTNSTGQRCSVVATVPCPSGNVTMTDALNGGAAQSLPDFDGTNVVPLNEQGFLEDQPVS